MDKKPAPHRRTVFVCLHKREDGSRPSCADAGKDAQKILDGLKEGVKAAGVKGVRVSKSGCLDVCEKGPNVLVYPEGDWYSGVSAADVPEILKKIAGQPT